MTDDTAPDNTTYQRFVAPGFLGAQREALEAGTLEEADSFVNLAGAAQLLKVPMGFVRPVIHALQLAQLNAPSDQEEVEVAGVTFKCDDIRSEKNPTNAQITDGYIRTRAVENLRPLVAKLQERALADKEKTGFIPLGITPSQKLLEKNIGIALLCAVNPLELKGFSINKDGWICTNKSITTIREMARDDAFCGEWKAIPDENRRAAGLVKETFLARKSGDESIEVMGETIPVRDHLQMAFGLGTVALMYKGNDTLEAITRINIAANRHCYHALKVNPAGGIPGSTGRG